MSREQKIHSQNRPVKLVINFTQNSLSMPYLHSIKTENDNINTLIYFDFFKYSSNLGEMPSLWWINPKKKEK